MKKAAVAVLVGLAMAVSSMVFTTDSEAKCTSDVRFKGPFKIVTKECYNHHKRVTTIKETRINRRTGRIVVIKKVINPWGHVRVTRRVVREGRHGGHHHWKDSRWAQWH